MESSTGELLANTHALNLELAVLDRLHQETDGLGADILVNLGVGSDLVHQDDQILEVDGQQSRVTTKQILEDFERLHDVVLLLLLNGVLENSDHGRDQLLESFDRSLILLRVQVHSKLAQRHESVDTNFGAFGVADGLVEEVEEVLELLLKSFTKSIQDGEENVNSHSALSSVAIVTSLQEQVGQVSPLAVVQIDLRNCGDDLSDGVLDER